MINQPPTSLQALSDEDTSKVARHILMALESIPRHRHNKRTAADGCGECIAKVHLIQAFRLFKRKGA